MQENEEGDFLSSTKINNGGDRNPERKRHGARNQHKMKYFLRWLTETFPKALEAASPESDSHILDVAGGKGELAARLCMCARKRVVMVDPRAANIAGCFMGRVLPQIPKKWQQNVHSQIKLNPSFIEDTVEERFRQIVGYFDEDSVAANDELAAAVEQATLLIGMHADGATEAILDVAIRKNKPFCVVPCCVFPNLFRHRTITNEEGLIVPVRSHDQFCQYLKEKDPRLLQAELPFDGRNVAIYFTGTE